MHSTEQWNSEIWCWKWHACIRISAAALVKFPWIGCGAFFSDRACFWGVASIVRKWTRNSRTKIRKRAPAKTEIAKRITHLKSAGYRVHQTIQRNKMKRYSLSLHNTRLPCVIVCLMLTPSPAYAVRITSVVFCTARCVDASCHLKSNFSQTNRKWKKRKDVSRFLYE